MESDEKIEWSAPAVVTQWQRAQVRLFIRQACPAVSAAIFLVWLLASIVAYFCGHLIFEEEPEKLLKWLFILGLSFLVLFNFMIVAPMLPALFSGRSDAYLMNEKGLYRRGYELALSISWPRLKDYRFADHHDLAGIRVLEFTVKPIKYIGDNGETWQQFYFDPQDIEEETLKAFIERHITT